jgi:hypothetical protein
MRQAHRLEKLDAEMNDQYEEYLERSGQAKKESKRKRKGKGRDEVFYSFELFFVLLY